MSEKIRNQLYKSFMLKEIDYSKEAVKIRMNELMQLRKTLFTIDQGSVDLIKIVKTPSN